MVQLVFLIGGFVLAAALLPTVFGREKPERSTCALTGTILTAYTLAFVQMGQWLSALGVGLTALLWMVLLVQKRRPHDV